MLKFKAAVLELIARGDPLPVVMDRMCREIELSFDGVCCSVLTVDRSGMLHPLSAPSLPDELSASLENLTIGPKVGSCGTAAYTGKPVETRDVATDPHWALYPHIRDAVLALGLNACWSSPLVEGSGVVCATFALYFTEQRGPTQAEREMVELCLHLSDLAFARHRRVTDRERRANTDALTGLPNQGSFARALAHLDCREPGAWALLLIDLDNLKIINDTFGHAAGDRLLQEVARRFARLAIPDGAFRIGGDEFVILIKAPERLADLAGTAESFFSVLAAPVEYEHFSIVPEATMGAAVVSHNDAVPETVRRNADIALYHAKETQRGSYVRYWPGIDTRIVARLSSIESLHAALAEQRVDAWYQPIVNLEDGRIVAMEALCRMVTAGGEVLPAALFAEATADARVAPVLTRRMLSLVRNDMRKWRDAGIDFGHVGVNITAVDLRGGRLAAMIDEIFAEDALLEKLVLEVTENVSIGDRDRLVGDTVRDLRRRGILIALDDFGTGYASLTHLLDLPVDFIKIDQSFTGRLPDDEVSATIIAGLIAIARKLGARVAAEGVETSEQVARLLDLGCDNAQGFLFSPGVDRAAAACLLMRHSARMPHSVPMPWAAKLKRRPARIAGLQPLRRRT